MSPFAPNKSLWGLYGASIPERSEVGLFACYKKATGLARGRPAACLDFGVGFRLHSHYHISKFKPLCQGFLL